MGVDDRPVCKAKGCKEFASPNSLFCHKHYKILYG